MRERCVGGATLLHTLKPREKVGELGILQLECGLAVGLKFARKLSSRRSTLLREHADPSTNRGQETLQFGVGELLLEDVIELRPHVLESVAARRWFQH